MKRRGTIALVAALALAGCQNMGLDYAGPEDEAVVAPPTDLVAAAHAPAATAEQTLIVDGRKWVPSGRPLALSQDDVRAVGSAGGQTVYARSWDRAPYDALYTQAQDSIWMSYRPVLGGGGAGGSGGGGAAAGH